MASGPSTETILKTIQASSQLTDDKWDSLVASFLSTLRSERNGTMEIARLLCERIVRDIDKIGAASTTLSGIGHLPAGKTMNTDELNEYVRVLRALVFGSSDEILSEAASAGASAVRSAYRAGSPADVQARITAALNDVAAAWADLGLLIPGARGFLAAVGNLPRSDISYMLYKSSQALSDAVASLETGGSREDAQNAVAAAQTMTRIGQQSGVPVEDLLPADATFDPGEPTLPARVDAQRSGPYAAVGANQLVLTTPELSEVVNVAAPGWNGIYLGATGTDGYYHLTIPAGVYNIRLAIDRLLSHLLYLNLDAEGSGSKIPAGSVVYEINSEVPGLATLVSLGGGAYTIRLEPSVIQPGPDRWLSFHSASNDGLYQIGFPRLWISNHFVSAELVAKSVSDQAMQAAVDFERVPLLRGQTAQAVDEGIRISRAANVIVDHVDGADIFLVSSVPGIQPGDELMLWESVLMFWAPFTVVQAYTDGTWFRVTVDSEPAVGLSWSRATINPVLPDHDPNVRMTIRLGDRYYSFTDADWVLATGQRMVSTPGFSYHELTTKLDFEIYQELLAVESKGTLLNSTLTVGNTPLAQEMQFYLIGSPLSPRANIVKGRFTEIDGFQSKVQAGDLARISLGGPTYWETTVEETRDGSIVIADPLFVSYSGNAMQISNYIATAWQTTVKSARLPSFDAEAYVRLAEQIAGGNDAAFTAAIAAVSALSTSLGSLRATADQFAQLSFPAQATAAYFKTFRMLGLWVVIEMLTQGDFSILALDYRDSSREGQVAVADANVAVDQKPNLTPLEILSLKVEADGR